jgi:acetyl esterase/lipase
MTDETQAGTAPALSRVDEQGAAHIQPFDVPVSSYWSDEARRAFIARYRDPPKWTGDDIGATRQRADELLYTPHLARHRERYPCAIDEEMVGGVRVAVVTPLSGICAHNEGRILVNLHGGGFEIGAGLGGLVEAIPIAATASVRVMTVDYRQGPEHRFPAASEDVASLYRALLQRHRPQDIGIFGCSAGGMLTAMSVAWFLEQGLPVPGAIALLSAMATTRWSGDSRFWGLALTGEAPDPENSDHWSSYLESVDAEDPLVSPDFFPELLARFPPTLIVGGTRDFAFSAAVESHRRLRRAGARARLHMWEGMWHAFFNNSDLPESRQVYRVVTDFFAKELGGR